MKGVRVGCRRHRYFAIRILRSRSSATWNSSEVFRVRGHGRASPAILVPGTQSATAVRGSADAGANIDGREIDCHRSLCNPRHCASASAYMLRPLICKPHTTSIEEGMPRVEQACATSFSHKSDHRDLVCCSRSVSRRAAASMGLTVELVVFIPGSSRARDLAPVMDSRQCKGVLLFSRGTT